MEYEVRPELSELIGMAKTGDLTALENLIKNYQQRIAGFVFTFTGEANVIEDLAQQVFIKMVQGLPRLKNVDRFEVWLFRLARNVCLSHFRKERLRRLFVAWDTHHDPVAPEPAQHDERIDWLRAAILKLPLAQRELLDLMANGTFNYEDLAQITGSSVSAVKSKLFRARDQLRHLKSHEF